MLVIAFSLWYFVLLNAIQIYGYAAHFLKLLPDRSEKPKRDGVTFQ